MHKQISRIASDQFSRRIAEIEPSLTSAVVKDADLAEASFQMGAYDKQRRFWIALAGLKSSDSHFCLRVAWTQVGATYGKIKDFVDGVPFPASGVADLRDYRQLGGMNTHSVVQQELWLGFVPDDVAKGAAADFLASESGQLLLRDHQNYELTLKRPRRPSEVEDGIRVATIANAGTWTGLMKIRPLSDENISQIVFPVVDKAVGIFKDFGLKFLRERLQV